MHIKYTSLYFIPVNFVPEALSPRWLVWCLLSMRLLIIWWRDITAVNSPNLHRRLYGKLVWNNGFQDWDRDYRLSFLLVFRKVFLFSIYFPHFLAVGGCPWCPPLGYNRDNLAQTVHSSHISRPCLVHCILLAKLSLLHFQEYSIETMSSVRESE